MSEEYTCEMCHGTYTSSRGADEALDEAEFIGFGRDPMNLVTVCEPCHNDLVQVSIKLGFMDEWGRLTAAGAKLMEQQGENQ